MEDNKVCPECRASWTGDVSKLFKMVPSEIFEHEENSQSYRDSTKTKMVLNVLKKCFFNEPLTEDHQSFSIKDKEEKTISLEEMNGTSQEGCKVVIFSQFNKMLDLLEQSFKENNLRVK